jgi:predicted  nucleic acid-binding Zn-ribbon protein
MNTDKRIVAIFKEDYALKKKRESLEAQKSSADWRGRGELEKEIDRVWEEHRKLEQEIAQIVKEADEHPLIYVAFKHEQGYIAGLYWLGNISFKGEIIVEE